MVSWFLMASQDVTCSQLDIKTPVIDFVKGNLLESSCGGKTVDGLFIVKKNERVKVQSLVINCLIGMAEGTNFVPLNNRMDIEAKGDLMVK